MNDIENPLVQFMSQLGPQGVDSKDRPGLRNGQILAPWVVGRFGVVAPRPLEEG
jgi:hypothetical protein